MSVNGIQITENFIFPVNKSEKSHTKAFVRIVLNDQITISGIRIIEGKKGLFIAFPQDYRKNDNKFFDLVYPTTHEMRKYISDSIISEYKEIEPKCVTA